MFERLCSLENLFLAWERFRKGKRSRHDVMVFERHLEDNLFLLHDDLANGRFTHGPYHPFTVFDPKQRSIHKANVRDRVVHQAAMNVIDPLFEPRFIFDSYSCRVGKGTHAAVARLRTFLRQASFNNTRTVYALTCDIRKFFASVDHGILADLLRLRIGDERILRLLGNIIGSFSDAPGKGIPLGNLTSQLFANVYLHELDRFVKHELRLRHYLRYCDDFVSLAASPADAQAKATRINSFLSERLKLTLHPGKVVVRTWTQGIDFVGYVLLPHATVLRTKTAKRMLRRATIENLSSYMGLCVHADAQFLSRTLRHKVWERHVDVTRLRG